MNVDEYLSLVDRAYETKGGIEGQRAPLKTKTALTIRRRLVDDLKNGAVIPPIVIGLLVTPGERRSLGRARDVKTIAKFLQETDQDNLSIIDGMQRTTALKEASSSKSSVLSKEVRVEIWVTELISSLIYRMLVLNTGQVPWELSRQLETVYKQLLKKISTALSHDDIQIFLKDDQRRRSDAGQYQSSVIVELFLIFSSRKDEVEIRDRVAEDFARLDTIETSSHADFIDYFVNMLKSLARLDKAFSRLEKSADAEPERFDAGKDIFASLPAMAGFTAAVAVYVFDQPGFDINWKEAPKRLKEVEQSIETISAKLDKLKKSQLGEFMQLSMLNQLLSGRRGGVGRFERDLFKRAFTMVIKNAARLQNLGPCWRAG